MHKCRMYKYALNIIKDSCINKTFNKLHKKLEIYSTIGF